jgi:hypothetical protein
MAQLISPIVDYMLRNQMIWDCTEEIAPRVEQKQFTFTASGVLGLQIWKPYFFDADDNLNGDVIKGIQVVTNLESQPIVGGTSTLSSLDAYGKVLLWLVDRGGDVVSVLPLSILIASRGNTIPTAFVKYQKFCLKDIVLQKCYLTISDTTGINVGDSILFNFFYEEKHEIVT